MQHLIFYRKNIYNFSTRYINNTLPTLKNMVVWKKAPNNLCKVCLNTQTLQRVVSGCKIHLNEKRYTQEHSPSVITGEERRPDIIIRDTNKLYVIELTVGFETFNKCRKKVKTLAPRTIAPRTIALGKSPPGH